MAALKIPGKRLSAAELLNVWEQGSGRSPAQQALQLLATACPGVPPERLARLPLGRRDACLLILREWTFGPRLEGMATCPECAAPLELLLKVADLWAEPLTADMAERRAEEGREVHQLSLAGFEVSFRLPDSLDLDAAASGEAAAFRLKLLERCLWTARQGGEPWPAGQLPAEVVAAVTEYMDRLDPQANLRLDLSCPACRHEWQQIFDIVSFFWSEIKAWAERLLHEVHTLASAYGWSEAEILALSPWRREVYLRMVGG